MDFNIYELLYALHNTHSVLGVLLIVIGIIAGTISFIGGLFSNSNKTTGIFIITLLLSALLMEYGVVLNHRLKRRLVNDYIATHNLNRCEVLKELSKFDKNDWLDVYYRECIKGGGQ